MLWHQSKQLSLDSAEKFHSAVSREMRERNQVEEQNNEAKDQGIQITYKVKEINSSAERAHLAFYEKEIDLFFNKFLVMGTEIFF